MIDYLKLKPRPKGPTIHTPLVPEDGLYLYDPGIFIESTCYQTPLSVTRKFVRIFQRAWWQIPGQDRSTLKEFWNPGRAADAEASLLPRIGFNLLRVTKTLKAACRGGHEIDFNLFWVDHSTQMGLMHIIAHELGHAISHPHGWYSQHECKLLVDDECTACECRAFSYMAAWGFDPFFEMLPKGKRLVERISKK